MPIDRSPIERLYWLTAQLLSGEVEPESFCPAFEETYNFDVDWERLDRVEIDAFGALFDTATHFSPFPDAKSKWPGYTNRAELLDAAENARLSLLISGHWDFPKRFADAVRRVLLEKWDPIGLGADSEFAGEYDEIVAGALSLVTADRDEEEIFKYLRKSETEGIGVQGDRGVTREVSVILVELWRKWFSGGRKSTELQRFAVVGKLDPDGLPLKLDFGGRGVVLTVWTFDNICPNAGHIVLNDGRGLLELDLDTGNSAVRGFTVVNAARFEDWPLFNSGPPRRMLPRLYPTLDLEMPVPTNSIEMEFSVSTREGEILIWWITPKACEVYRHQRLNMLVQDGCLAGFLITGVTAAEMSRFFDECF